MVMRTVCCGRKKTTPITKKFLIWTLSLLRPIKRPNPRPYAQDIGMHEYYDYSDYGDG